MFKKFGSKIFASSRYGSSSFNRMFYSVSFNGISPDCGTFISSSATVRPDLEFGGFVIKVTRTRKNSKGTYFTEDTEYANSFRDAVDIAESLARHAIAELDKTCFGLRVRNAMIESGLLDTSESVS